MLLFKFRKCTLVRRRRTNFLQRGRDLRERVAYLSSCRNVADSGINVRLTFAFFSTLSPNFIRSLAGDNERSGPRSGYVRVKSNDYSAATAVTNEFLLIDLRPLARSRARGRRGGLTRIVKLPDRDPRERSGRLTERKEKRGRKRDWRSSLIVMKRSY